jgi:4-aminobutyrate aminotransferase-like enzyme
MVYLSDRAKEKRLIMGSAPGTGILRMMPYLIITEDQVDEGLKLLEETIEETCKKFDYPKKE